MLSGLWVVAFQWCPVPASPSSAPARSALGKRTQSATASLTAATALTSTTAVTSWAWLSYCPVGWPRLSQEPARCGAGRELKLSRLLNQQLPSPSVSDCGMTPAVAFSKIVGGSGAARGEWPWQVSLWLRRKEHKCGAVLIADKWLLSAAHCFDIYSDPKMWVAVLGTPFLSGTDGRVEKIFRIYKHPFYNVYTLDYDVALLELATAVRFTSTIKPICLPDNSHVFREGARCFITGWGATKEGGMAPGTQMHLQKAAVNVIGDQACKKFYPIQISGRMVCAGFPQGTIDSCSGDAGGPLACKEPSGRWFLAGITSWGYGCARPYFPGVYTKVTAVRGWIGQNLKL
uniref:Peptidase S1 domain-containing protein n=1 Tax=Chelonoidis abingdonii TaxID=106734 RepID=A0A8C0JAW7_CHEAB